MSDDGWRHSSEGDLDPDLTEEAGWAGWEAPDRSWLAPVLRAVMALVLVSFILGLVFRVL